MAFYFTSDTHFGHKNFVRGVSEWADTSFCRDFDSIIEHDRTLIMAINETVKRDDVLIHLGDFCFPSTTTVVNTYRRQITCQNLWVLPGNHDKIAALKHAENILMLPPGIFELKSAKSIEQPMIVMCHYAMRTWNKAHFGTWHLFGHTHAQLHIPDDSLSLDVGVDTRADWRPYSIQEIKAHMDTKTFVPIQNR